MHSQNNATDPAKSTQTKIQLVTFRQFGAFARGRNLTAQALAERFRGKIESPLEFFNRVLAGKSPDTIIPYRSVLEFFASSQAAHPIANHPTCACGCGAPVFDRKKWASPGCRTKAQRAKVTNEQFWLGQVIDFVKPRLRQNGRVASLPLTGARKGFKNEIAATPRT